jgi:hypothetical protein
MRSYNSLVGRVKNKETKEVNNLAVGLQSLASTGSLTVIGGGSSGGGSGDYDASINYIYDNFATIAYVDSNSGGGGNVDLSSYTTKTYVDLSLNTLKTYANATYATKTYVDSSVNAINASLTSYATKSYVDTSLNTNYATKTYVDSSLNTNYATSASLTSYATKSYVDSSLNTNYATSASLTSYATKSYVDSSLNTNYATTSSLTSYATKTYVDSSINSLKTAIDNRFDLITNGASTALDTLGEIATAIQGDASFGIQVYSRIDKLDASVNSIDTSLYATKIYVDTSLNTNYATKSYADAIRTYVDSSLNANYATTASLSSYATKTYVDTSLNAYLKSGLTYDVSMTGNVQLGNGTKYVAINKAPGSTYALDVSGQTLITGSTFITGNLSVSKSSTDASYSMLDLSGVNLNIFGTIEKFNTITYSSTSLSLNCVNGTVFDISGVGASITAIAFTNVPATLRQSVSLTVLLRQSPAAKWFFTGSTITVNGISCTFLKPDSTALAAPSNNSSVVILQFVVLWVSLTAPVVLTYMSAQG